MADTFRCTVTTPEEQVVDETVTYVSFPAWDGQMGVAPGRAPMLAKLGVGTVRLDFPGGASRWFLLEGGFAQMLGNELSILSDRSTAAERIATSDANADLAAAEQLPSTTDEEHAAKQRAIQAAREKRRLAKITTERGI